MPPAHHVERDDGALYVRGRLPRLLAAVERKVEEARLQRRQQAGVTSRALSSLPPQAPPTRPLLLTAVSGTATAYSSAAADVSEKAAKDALITPMHARAVARGENPAITASTAAACPHPGKGARGARAGPAGCTPLSHETNLRYQPNDSYK